MTENLSSNYITKIIENYFKNPLSIINHQIQSYNEFILRDIPRILSEEQEIVIVPKKNQKYIITFGQTHLPTACVIEDRKIQTIYPRDARNKNLDYCSPLYVDITETLIEKDVVLESKVHRRVPICRIPVMISSCVCSLTNLTYRERVEVGECFNDPGGYFIIKGVERVLIGQVRNAYNEIITGPYKNSTDSKYNYAARIRSMSEQTGHSVQVLAKIGTDKRTIAFAVPYVTKSILAGIIFKALGFIKDDDIINLIGLTHPKTKEYVTYIIRDSYFIQTQEEALDYIKQYIMHVNPKDKQVKYVEQVLCSELFPHMGVTSTIKEKAIFLGHMINKLIMTYTGLRDEDSKDNCGNKRIETSGILLSELFRTLFKRYTKTLTEQLKKRQDIIFQIQKNTSLTSGLKQSMTSSNWGVPKNTYIRTGVSQVLSRLSYQAFISHLRRIGINVGKSDKNAKLRQIHQSQYGAICPTECFDPMTPIIMWDGSIKLAKDIKVNDMLIDDNGNKTRVKSVCGGFDQMFEIVQDKGMNYTVTHNHILTLKILGHNIITYNGWEYELKWFNKDELNYSYKFFKCFEDAITYSSKIDDDILDITLEKYITLSDIIKNNLVGFKCNNVKWDKKNTNADPYILGVHIYIMEYFEDEQIDTYFINDFENRYKLFNGITNSDYDFEKLSDKLFNKIITLGMSLGVDEIDRKTIKNCKINKKINQTSFKVIKKDIGPFCGWQLDGNGRFLLSDFTVTHNTPEGQPVGTVLSLTMCARITKRIPTVIIQDVIEKCDSIINIDDLELHEYKLYTKIFLNGCIVGYTEDYKEVLRDIKSLRDSDLLDENVSIRYEDIDDEIHILSDEGRIIRPLFTVENGKLRITKEDGIEWDKLNRYRKIVYIDVAENQTVNIAMYPRDVDEDYDYCEIDPSLMLGVCASCIPFPDHNPAPRNCFQASMGKQAMGIPVTSFQTRADTMLHVLSYPQKAFVNPKMATYIGMNDMPSGINAIVAILTYSGLTMV